MQNTKYKFIETTGCTAFDFSVNNKSISELSNEEHDKILDYLFVKVKEGINQNTILFTDVVKLFQPDNWEYDNHICESCGDTVETITWDI
jgi:glucuronate isomerase